MLIKAQISIDFLFVYNCVNESGSSMQAFHDLFHVFPSIPSVSFLAENEGLLTDIFNERIFHLFPEFKFRYYFTTLVPIMKQKLLKTI